MKSSPMVVSKKSLKKKNNNKQMQIIKPNIENIEYMIWKFKTTYE